jgi:hypothetical protein
MGKLLVPPHMSDDWEKDNKGYPVDWPEAFQEIARATLVIAGSTHRITCSRLESLSLLLCTYSAAVLFRTPAYTMHRIEVGQAACLSGTVISSGTSNRRAFCSTCVVESPLSYGLCLLPAAPFHPVDYRYVS